MLTYCYVFQMRASRNRKTLAPRRPLLHNLSKQLLPTALMLVRPLNEVEKVRVTVQGQASFSGLMHAENIRDDVASKTTDGIHMVMPKRIEVYKHLISHVKSLGV